jgi:hypothetical protein
MPSSVGRTRTITTVYLDEDLREALKLLKNRDGIPEAEQIRRALRGWLQDRKALGVSLPTGVKRPKQRKK